MITKPKDMTFAGKKLFIIIAGVAGIGKTTLALSAPKPLLIDLDNGIDRVEARYRADTEHASSYIELMNDLTNADLSEYESIVIDTGGKLLEFLKPVVIGQDRKNSKSNGELSLQGYGAVKKEFNKFVDYIRALKKHVIMVFHATEVPVGDDTTGLRIRIEGRSRDEVWDNADIGGFVEMKGNKHTIGFSNCDRYYAKGTHGIHGIYEIPTLDRDSKNTFLTDLINKVLEDLESENKEATTYTKLMARLIPIIATAKDVKGLNKAYDEIKKADHILTSKNECWNAINEKAKMLGATYDKQTNTFTDTSGDTKPVK